MGRNEATTTATRLLETERSEVSRTALGSGGEALLRTRVGERTDVGWAWRGRCSLPSRRRTAHALPPGRHGDRTRPASAPALARRPGAAPASGGRGRGPREQRAQVTVPSLHPPCRPFPFLFLGPSLRRRWRLLGGRPGRTAGGLVFNLEAWVTPSRGTRRVAPRKPSVPFR